jgi:hypothetical protein
MITTENNKLIAEFMNEEIGFADTSKPCILIDNVWSPIKYHKSWDWLMPVVQKIDSMEYNVVMSRISVNINPILEDNKPIVSFVCGDIEQKLSLLHESITEFIKWYNENK